ncbi:DUF6545 domain-containing protein [Streptomyces sp. NPDC046862]|uniref:DUF6545 domain-containing protein n=1 Tax=Streptomyces sp. NPDC046862 TaxID=3154603 RepID=UPI00345614C8
MDSRLRTACEERLALLNLPHRFGTGQLCDAVAAWCGKPLIPRPLDTTGFVDAPSGVSFETDEAFFLFYERGTSRLHRLHILAHGISHVLCGHIGSLPWEDGLVPAPRLEPEFGACISGRTRYATADEREAEMMATLIRQHIYRGRQFPTWRPAAAEDCWERHSVTLLDPLWQDLTRVLPHIVLEVGADHELDFLLHRKVIEINDGILALRPHRSRSVKQAAAEAVAARQLASTAEGDAIIEAAVLAAALNSARSSSEPDFDPAPPTPGTRERAGDLRAETTWLRQVSQAYTTDPIVHSVRLLAASPAPAGK